MSPATPAAARRQLVELYWSAGLAYRQGRLVDFVARVWRLVEASLRLEIETALGVTTDDRARENGRHPLWAAIEARPALRAAVEAEGIAGGAALDIPLFIAVVDGMAAEAAEAGAPRARIQARLAVTARALKAIREQRNRSVVGHDFAGIGETELTDAARDGAASAQREAEARSTRHREAERAAGRPGDSPTAALALLREATGEVAQPLEAGGADGILEVLKHLLLALGAGVGRDSLFSQWGHRLTQAVMTLDTATP